LGGTNAHLILEEAPEEKIPKGEESKRPQLIILSAKTESALEQATSNLVDYLKNHRDENFADIVYTLQVGRRDFEHRRAVVCEDIEDAIAALETLDVERALTHRRHPVDRPVAFMFSGLGDHYVNMALGLYSAEPTFRNNVDRCCELLKPYLGIDLRDVIYPNELRAEEVARTDGREAQTRNFNRSKIDLRRMLKGAKDTGDEPNRKLNQTELAQPAIFVIEYALAELWIEKGARPQAMIGYSIGEFVAAHLAGVFTLEEALMLVAERARIISNLPNGAMLAAPLSEAEIGPLLDGGLSVAAINGPELCVVSGPSERIGEFEMRMAERGIACRSLQTSHAFHSRMMKPAVAPFMKVIGDVRLGAPKIPYISTVTGNWVTAKETTDPGYWARHMCEAVQFAAGLKKLLKERSQILLEVGPGQALCAFAMQHPEGTSDQIVVSSLPQSYDTQSDASFFSTSIAKLWLAGMEVNWAGLHQGSGRRRRLALPTYPFQRSRFWVDGQNGSTKYEPPVTNKNAEVSQWFYAPIWKQSPALSSRVNREASKQQRWLIFADEDTFGSRLAQRLKRDHEVVRVGRGRQLLKIDNDAYTSNPGRREDYAGLMKELRALNQRPTNIVYLWTLTPEFDEQDCDNWRRIAFDSLLYLAQVIGAESSNESLDLAVITNSLHDITGDERLRPGQAIALGPCRVIPQEYPDIACRAIDIIVPAPESQLEAALMEKIISELISKSKDTVVAYRGNHRWAQAFEPVKLESVVQPIATQRAGGVYLITGGLGGLGLAVAESLAQTPRTKLVLVGRTGLPEKALWNEILSSDQEPSILCDRVRKVQTLERLGAEVMIAQADVANPEQVRTMIDHAIERFGPITGVVHAAGVPGAGLIQLKTPEMVTNVLSPKVKGALVLAEALKDMPLDFFCLFSSLTSLTGGFGQVDYCAANAFLDALAHYNTSRGATPTVSINWGSWQWDNWQESFLGFDSDLQRRLKESRNLYGMTNEEGIDAFNRVLSSGLPQIVVSPQDLNAVIAQHHAFTASSALAKIRENRSSISSHARPAIGVTYVAARDETEGAIATIWQDLLGIEEVGVYDNFFELGGHSLLLVQLVSRLRASFDVELPIQDLFRAATVAEMAEMIKNAKNTVHRELESIVDTLSLVEQLSEDDVARLLVN
jgi:acyl transferase domain-containing protein/acyl carrier protein